MRVMKSKEFYLLGFYYSFSINTSSLFFISFSIKLCVFLQWKGIFIHLHMNTKKKELENNLSYKTVSNECYRNL